MATSCGIVLHIAQPLIEDIYASVLDCKALIDSNWHYLYDPSGWSKCNKVAAFLMAVRQYLIELSDNANKKNPDSNYYIRMTALNTKRYETTSMATTNCNKIIEEILGVAYPLRISTVQRRSVIFLIIIRWK
jgi:hypothetical protein